MQNVNTRMHSAQSRYREFRMLVNMSASLSAQAAPYPGVDCMQKVYHQLT